ncbi:MAG: hypothetical protein AAGB97_04775 [Dehalococcoidia bacterium]
MEPVIAGIIGMVLLAPLIGLNLVISMGKTLSKKVAGLVFKFRTQDIGVAEHSGLVCIMPTQAGWSGFVVASHHAYGHMASQRSAH